MDNSPDSDIEKLLSEVTSLYTGNKSQSTAQAPASKEQAPSIDVGTWHCPIRGSWHNLGGFNPSMARYDDLAKNPKATKGRGHMGVDMGAAAGTPVYAMGPGEVDTAGTDPMGGNIVGVKHHDGVWTYYAHLSTVKVRKGEKVDQNTIVGTVGNTGNPGNPKNPLVTMEGGRTWPHLHFGVKQNGSWVDPSKFFSVPKYDAEYAKNPGKYQKFWLNDQAKQEAEAFNMKDHVKTRTASTADKLMKIAFAYYRIIDQSK